MGILSQPLSRGAALFAVVAVGVALSGSVPKRQGLPLVLSQFAYLWGLAMTLGIANWTTFVFGIVAFKTLARKTFGLLQAKLFPKYFQVLTISLAISLLTFTSVKGQRTSAQLRTLVIALVCNLANLLVIEPVTTATMFDRHKLETASADDAAASKDQSSAEMKRLNKRFGMLHGISSLLNLFTLGAVHVHLWNLATSLSTL